jgi:hypothetical protein
MNCTAHVDTIKFWHINFIYITLKDCFLCHMKCLSLFHFHESDFTHSPVRPFELLQPT